MIEQTQIIEVVQPITATDRRAIEGMGADATVTFVNGAIYRPPTPEACANVWAYVCDHHIRATLINTTRVSNFERQP